jgi:hypothetical protein
MEWEYYTLVLGAQSPALFSAGGQVDEREFDREMNRLGRQGWELLVGLATSRRPLTDEPPGQVVEQTVALYDAVEAVLIA